MTNREKFKQAVIENIHGLPYEEALENYLLSASMESPVIVNSWADE